MHSTKNTFFVKFRTPLLLWFVVTMFFAFQFILRLSAGILREDIIQKFSIDTAAFGTLAGYYYLGYAGMQIPLGIMLDKFHFRIVTCLSIMITVIGTLTFIISDSWNMVLLGRFLIGAGSAVGFLAVAKVIKLFFEEKHHAFMIGFAFTFGLTGAVFGGTPMRLVFDSFGYSATFIALAITGSVLAILILLVNDKKIERIENNPKTHPTFRQILRLLTNPILLCTGIAGGLMVGPLEGFADVWAMPFFEHIHHLSTNDAIFISSLVFFGMCFGGPILAYLARMLNSNIIIITLTGLLTVIIFAIIFFVHNISITSLGILMFFLGILCCYQVLIFAFVADIVDRSCAGITIAIINCLNMSFGHFFHYFISQNIQTHWRGNTNASGVPLYDFDAYIYALSIIPICCVIGTLIFLYLSCTKIKKYY
jgi:predicted MFS family arabinose efflux permease